MQGIIIENSPPSAGRQLHIKDLMRRKYDELLKKISRQGEFDATASTPVLSKDRGSAELSELLQRFRARD